METVSVDIGATIRRSTFDPERSWGKCVKPILKTNSYEIRNTMYITPSRIKVGVYDRSEVEGGPSDAAIIPLAQKTLVVGYDPCVVIKFTLAKNYAKPKYIYLFPIIYLFLEEAEYMTQ